MEVKSINRKGYTITVVPKALVLGLIMLMINMLHWFKE